MLRVKDRGTHPVSLACRVGCLPRAFLKDDDPKMFRENPLAGCVTEKQPDGREPIQGIHVGAALSTFFRGANPARRHRGARSCVRLCHSRPPGPLTTQWADLPIARRQGDLAD